MTSATVLTSVKGRLGITATTWDTILNDFSQQAVNRLYPLTAVEVDYQDILITVDSYGEAIVDLSAITTPVLDVRTIEAYDGFAWFPVSNIYRHGTKLRVRNLDTSMSKLRLYGLNNFTYATVPSSLELPVIWFTMAQFYEYLASNKAQYNIYSQTNGARAVDNMRDEAANLENKASMYIEENSTIYGSV